MEIIITKNNVYQYAMALTARAATTGDAFAQTTITEDNFPMLDVYLSESVPLVEGELRKKLSKSNAIDMTLDESSIVISIKEQRNADTSVYNLVECGARLFAAYYIASRWLQTTQASTLAEVYGTTAATHLKTATEALAQKNPTTIPDGDYDARDTEGSRMEATGGTSDYDIRDKEDSRMESSGNGGDYSVRATDITDMSEGGMEEAYYTKRKRDNVMARPGMRIMEGELIAVISEDERQKQELAITRTAEILISN